ncbi:thiamine pyrophosphate-binding protein [Streptomyces sp. NBC_00285]|uniref:thiamine pyrophosphate-binding protein n=1 Tax=Streptomyces sp. NBC_00285 TaxID=2975700 RepID=UPI002E2E2CA9|nr:thiamine pyrophosphate-binding protein [Streptomyces sp. NBC_00285]
MLSEVGFHLAGSGKRLFSDYLLRVLKQSSVDTLFCVPGSAIGPLLDRTLTDVDLRLVVARHESGAVAMADGYARATGRLGVAMVTSGPGALNALPHLAVAQADGSPVLLISGAVARSHHGRGGFQEGAEDGVDVVGALGRCVKYSREIGNSHSAPQLVDNAVRHALTAPRGAAHLSVPVDLFTEDVDSGEFGGKPLLPSETILLGGVVEIVRALLAAERPMLVLGNGAREALRSDPGLGKALAGFAERFAVPTATTMKGKGLFPETHPQALGVMGVGGSRRAHVYLTRNPPDVVVVVGSGLGEWASANWSPALRGTRALVQVDVDPAKIGRAYPVDHAVHADAGEFLRAMLAEADESAAHRPHQEPLRRRRDALEDLPDVVAEASVAELGGVPVTPQALMHHLQRWTAGIPEALVFVDIGNSTGWFTQRVAVDPPSQVHCPLGMASMGWASAAVIGAKLARPEATCVTITGDGGFLMNATEIATAARLRVGAIWVVLDDNAFNMVRQGMDHSFPDTMRTTDEDFGLGGPNLVGLAESLGARAWRVGVPDQIPIALDQARRAAEQDPGPQVICVSIDRDEPGPFRDRNESVGLSFRAPR